jgi:hypothetical protein
LPQTAAVKVKIADLPQVKAAMTRLSDALELFAALSDEERAALPDAARQGLDALAGAEAATARLTKPDGFDYWGYVIIEWPAFPQGKHPKPIPGWGCVLINAETGRQFNTCRKIELHADTENIITADLTMFADGDGKPAFELEPGDAKGSLKIPALEDGRIREGTFPFFVSEMRVREEGQ